MGSSREKFKLGNTVMKKTKQSLTKPQVTYTIMEVKVLKFYQETEALRGDLEAGGVVKNGVARWFIMYRIASGNVQEWVRENSLQSAPTAASPSQ